MKHAVMKFLELMNGDYPIQRCPVMHPVMSILLLSEDEYMEKD